MSQKKRESAAVEASLLSRTGEREPTRWGWLSRGTVRALISTLAFMVAWEFFARATPPYVAPVWADILVALIELPYEFVLITTARVLAALVLSFALAILIGGALYNYKAAEAFTLPLLKLLMAVPATAWVIFTVLWFRSVEYRIAFVLAVVCAPIFAIDFLDALKSVPKQYREMVRSFRPSAVQYYSKLLLPATAPAMLTSWKVNLSLAIRVVTIAELVGAVSGIGYGLVIAKELFSVATVFAWTVVLVLILFGAQAVIELVERRLLRWRD